MLNPAVSPQRLVASGPLFKTVNVFLIYPVPAACSVLTTSVNMAAFWGAAPFSLVLTASIIREIREVIEAVITSETCQFIADNMKQRPRRQLSSHSKLSLS
jgi:hypothetical protein